MLFKVDGEKFIPYKTSGKKLRYLRGERTLQEVADASNGGFTDVALLYWEKERRKPSDDSIKTLMRVYKCSLEDIVEPENSLK